ncbi:MAG: sodium:calcium antiporter [Nanoarchaeota archaeon]
MNVVNYIMSTNPLVFYSVVALASLIILSKSSDMLVYGISNYAKKLGVSDFLIGFIVVSIGTALPELVASLTGALSGEGAIVFGTIFGSNIFKVPLLGLVLILGRKLKIKDNDLGMAPIITLVIIVIPLILVLDGSLSRIDGVILITAFVVYISRLWNKEGKMGRMKKDVLLKNIYQDGIIFVLSLTVLLISGRLLVYSSISISKILDVSPYIIGLVVIGIGASMPELTVQIRSIRTKHSKLAFGNIFGSLIANSALVLGLTAFIKPFKVDINLLWLAGFVMISAITYVLFLMGKKELTWKHGLILIVGYLLYLSVEIIF